MQNTTLSALNPAKYREYLAQCAAVGRNPLPAHSVTDNGCWALAKPNKPRPSGHIQICRYINGKQYRMQLHTLSLLYANAPRIWRDIDAIQADGVSRAMACHKPICAGNKACFNPAHLRLDDDAGNKRDMLRDGVYKRGGYKRAKLTDAQACAIRAEAEAGASKAAIARKYGVSVRAIYLVINREIHAHSDGRLI